MLEIKFLRKNMEVVEAALKARHADVDLGEFKTRDQKRLDILQRIETLRHERNVTSDAIAEKKKAGLADQEAVLHMREVSGEIKNLEKELTDIESVLEGMLLSIPNIPHVSVPVGRDETQNPIYRQVGEPPVFDFQVKDHQEIGEGLGILDFERASRITGARFPLYFGLGARLERAVINFMLDIHTIRHGYTEVLPPFMVNRESMTHTGQLPKFEEDLFKVENKDYFLIPTAEVPVTNIHQGEILDEDQLPKYYTAFTPCFRAEAGSYGKDTRGLIRQHQFNKVELVKFTSPDTSYQELETLLEQAETILKELKLAYRVVVLCTGDLGFSSAKTYDIEVWMPAQNRYREISSCSNFEAFQARRGNIRYRQKGKKGTDYLHTLNGSGLAVGRTVAAIMENYQLPDGSVIIPEALRPFMGGVERITK
jgi:seryl-tRNA synthetase